MLIDGHRHQFLAGAGLAGDQHRYVLARHPANGLVDLAHRRTGTDDRAIGIEFSRDGGHHAQGRACDEHRRAPVADHALELFKIEGLEQIVESALLHRLDGRVGTSGNRDENNRDAGVEPADLPMNLQARAVGQTQIEQDHVGAVRADALEPRGRGASRLNRVERRGKDVPHLLHNQGAIVVDNQ